MLKYVKAVIFDMDGTLVDNIPFHRKAWISFLEQHGIILTPEEFLKQDHGNIYDTIRKFFGQDFPDEKVIEQGQKREKIYRDLYRNHIEGIDGLKDLLEKLRQLNIKISLTTMSDTPQIDLVLDKLNIRKYFHSITNGLEIKRGKPDPEIYDTALRKLDLKNTDCLAIEDSIGGIMSATRAGIKVIGITTSHTVGQLVEYGCLSTISSFHELIAT